MRTTPNTHDSDEPPKEGYDPSDYPLTPEAQEWIRRLVAEIGPLTDDEREFLARIFILVEGFRLPEVLEHIEAGRIVIVVPSPAHPD